MPSETIDRLTADVVLDDAHPTPGMPFGHQPMSVGVEDKLRRDNEILRRELSLMRTRAVTQQQKLNLWEKERDEAAALQRNLLPDTLPQSDFATFGALFEPMDTVAGDLYHVVRLDEQHIAMWVVDATGHGTAAGTLVACVQRSLCRIAGGDTQINAMAPSAVLAQLNREMITMDLTDCQFVAAVYAVFNERTGSLRWSRGGGCHPVVVRSNRETESLVTLGPLVGVTDEAFFETGEVPLGSGDTVLFYSDGLESAVAPNIGHTADENSVAHWVGGKSATNETLIIKQIDQQVRQSRLSDQADDVAVVALHVPATAS